jgi:hypothetical protein
MQKVVDMRLRLWLRSLHDRLLRLGAIVLDDRQLFEINRPCPLSCLRNLRAPLMLHGS